LLWRRAEVSLKSRNSLPSSLLASLLILACLLPAASCFAVDSDTTRATLLGIKGVRVIIEELQPNIQKYTKKQEISKEQLLKQVEDQLRTAGIKALNQEEWLVTPGTPVLYVNVNTHEFEKYRFAFDVSVQLRQIVSLEREPSVKSLAPTWSTNMTGVVNVGTIGSLNESVKLLVGNFIKAYASVNKK
jgi:hypothetical protein